MDLMKKALLPAVFILVVFIMVELSYRFYVIGPQAFDWRKINSMTTLMRSQFVSLSDYPEVFFELKPNMNGWFKAKPFFTNSAGMADKEYQQDKPDNVFRVAVVGSSWTMPTGVEQGDAWHSLMEEEFNSEAPARAVEFINFGVEMYGLREIVATVRHKVAAWEPDLVIVAITSYTTSFIWEEADANQALPEKSYPALQSYALSGLAGVLGFSVARPADDRPRFGADVFDERLGQVQRAITELNDFSGATGIPVTLVFLGFSPMGSAYEEPIDAQVANTDLELIYANRLFVDMPDRTAYQVSRFDRHPNEAGHRLIAEFLADELRRKSLLPVENY